MRLELQQLQMVDLQLTAMSLAPSSLMTAYSLQTPAGGR